MAVECIEWGAIISLMAHNDDRPIILRLRIVGERMHVAAKRRVNRSAGRSEDVDAEMDGTPGEEWRRVDETWLVPPPNASGDAIHRDPTNAQIEPLPRRHIHDRRKPLRRQPRDDARRRHQWDASQ